MTPIARPATRASVAEERPPADRGAREDVLLRVARLVTDCPEITELDVNPLMAMPSGVIAADVRVILGSALLHQ